MKVIHQIIIQILALAPHVAFPSVTSQGIFKIRGYQEILGVIKPEINSDWDRGEWAVYHSANRGSLGIEVINPDAGSFVRESLIIEESKQESERYKVWKCSSGQCSSTKVTKISSSEYDLDLGSIQVRLRDYGPLCREKSTSCQYFISSWALAALAQSKNKSSPITPNILVILKSFEKISLFDPQSKKFWMTLRIGENSPIRTLGNLEKADFQKDGKLIIHFSQGSSLLDLANDLALISDSAANLSILEHGLGQGELNHFKLVYSGNHEKLLLLGGSFLISQRQALKFDWNFNKAFSISETSAFTQNWHAASSISLNPYLVNLKSESEGSKYQFASIRFIPEITIFPQTSVLIQDPQKMTLAIAGASIYRIGDGLKWQDKSNRWIDLLEKINDTAYSLKEKSYFFLRNSSAVDKSDTCEWVRMTRDSEDQFHDDGYLNGPCKGSFQAYEARERGAMGTWQLGNEFGWKVWWNQKSND